MRKILRFTFLFAFASTFFLQKGVAQISDPSVIVFPYGDTFKGSTASGMIFGQGIPGGATPVKNAYLTAAPGPDNIVNDAAGAGYLRLTDQAVDQVAYAYNTTVFPSTYGVSSSFEYYTWHADPQPIYYAYADGISFYLFDASVTSRDLTSSQALGYPNAGFNIGGYGGSLGYAQRNNPQPGLSKGFLGIGIDEFGNFAVQSEGRQGGDAVGGALENQSSVTLRGDGDGAALAATNYEFLIKKRTDGSDGTTPGAGDLSVDGGIFDLKGNVDGRTAGAGGLTPLMTGYRKAKIEIIPVDGSNNPTSTSPVAFKVNVWITEGNPSGAIVHHVIQDYIYTPTGGVIPATLSYGFAAATGSSVDTHEIRAIDVAVPSVFLFAPNSLEAISVSTPEDNTYTFTTTDFTDKFRDPNGFTTLSQVAIYNLPSASSGVLKRNGVNITEGQIITIADINSGLLTFVPASNYHGTVTGIKWDGYDDTPGGSGGPFHAASSSDYGNLSIVVRPVNDIPAGADKTVNTVADDPYKFVSSDFTLTDAVDGATGTANTLTAVKIVSLPLKGLLKLNGTNILAGATIALADINGSNFTFTPDAAEVGTPYTTFPFQVQDNGGVTDGGVDLALQNTMTINVNPINIAPTSAAATVTMPEDPTNAETVIPTSKFALSDTNVPPNTLLLVRITAVPTSGVLYEDLDDDNIIDAGEEITAGETVSKVNLDLNRLKFRPVANENGAGYGNFSFKVTDNGGTQGAGVAESVAAYLMTVNVTPVNDRPSFTKGVDQVVVENAGAQTVNGWATALSKGPADESGQALDFVITANSNTGLFSAGPAVSPTGDLTYTPVVNANGVATITLKIHDNGGTPGVDESATQSFTITVTPANSAPLGTDKTIAMLEDASYSFVASDFGFSDPNDTSPNALLAVKIISTPSVGTFRFNGAAVSNGQVIPAANLAQLIYSPLPNQNGAAYANFTFQVQDDGGTSPGSDLDPVAKTITFDVTPVNDAPGFTKGSNQTAVVSSGAKTVTGWATNITPGPASATDEAGQTLAFTVTNDNNPLFTVQPAISSTGTLTFTPSGVVGVATVTVFIKDNGLTANGGVDQSANQTFTITTTTTPNNAPVAVADNYSVVRSGTLTITAPGILGNDTDTEGNALTAVKVTDPLHGTLTQNSNGSFTYVNDGGSATSDSYTYKANDGSSDSNIATVSITINTPGGSPPVAVNDATTTPEDTPVTVSVLTNDSDPDNDPLTVITATVATGTVVINSGTTLTYTPPTDFVGTVVIDYTISDGHGGTAAATVTVVITENRSIAINVTEVCINDVPWVQYTVSATGFTPAANSVLIQWKKMDGSIVRELTNQSLTGQLLWPGAVVDGDGKPTAWPGWEFTGGQWVQINDGLRPQMKMYIKVNPETEVVVNYPPATPFCSANPNLPPVAGNDVASTPKNTPVVISVKDNDTDPDGTIDLTTIDLDPSTPGEQKTLTKPEGVYVANNNGTVTFTPVSTYVGTPTAIRYTIKDNDGSISNEASITISVAQPNQPPVVADITKTGGYLPIPFTVTDFTSKYTDPEGTALVKIKIPGLPANGTLKLSGVNVTVGQEIPTAQLANLTFTPVVNWSGSTSFPWNGSDGSLYAVNNANVNITVTLPTDPTAKIGVAKKLVSVTDGLNGSFNIKYLFTAVNYGLNALENISLQDNLAITFAGTETKINSVTAYGNLKANALYDGKTITELLLPSSRLNSGEEAQVELEVNVQLQLTGGLFQNTATAEGYSSVTGFKVTDKSTNGLKPDPTTAGDVSPFEATPVELTMKATFVPQGFSPNGDGVNDYFFIQNALSNNVALEVYNRWGNRVYKSNEYRNDWDGRCTEGFFTGRDIPDGTYFYVIVIDKKDKYQGYITINR